MRRRGYRYESGHLLRRFHLQACVGEIRRDTRTCWYLASAYVSMFASVGAESELPFPMARQAGKLPCSGGCTDVHAAYFIIASVCSWAYS